MTPCWLVLSKDLFKLVFTDSASEHIQINLRVINAKVLLTFSDAYAFHGYTLSICIRPISCGLDAATGELHIIEARIDF